MERVLTSLRQHVRRMRVAYVVLALSLIPTAVVYYRVRANVESRDRTRFDRLVREQRAAIEQRIPHYVDEMMGVRGLFMANPVVTPSQWQEYLSSIEIPSLYPGIGTLGYIERVEASGKECFH